MFDSERKFQVSVWWKYSDDDVFPWSPLVKDIDRANIHIFHINGYGILDVPSNDDHGVEPIESSNGAGMYLNLEVTYQYLFHSSKVEFLCHHRTLHDVLSVTFSAIEPHVLFVVEQKLSPGVSISKF